MSTTQSADPNERVDHPRHYNAHGSNVETIELIEHLPCNFANAVKYIWRCGLKTTETPLRDLKSARWYTEREARRHRLFELNDDDVFEPKTSVVWRALARAVIEHDDSQSEASDGDGTVLASYLDALLRNDFEDMLGAIDEEIEKKQNEGAS